ncbi:hypothetical protein [Halorubrum sp. Ea1]|uniref:hypothetical protein n=1 Tax=Halorubrum sp. Ea1 TaxID=1480718 RepID=UPI001594F0FF|nr:hypothetical protein [Halorubrum sp. Ea1]
MTFLVRHAKWMATRRAIVHGTDPEPNGSVDGHPDLRDLNENESMTERARRALPLTSA